MEVDKTSEKDHDSGGEENESMDIKVEVCVTCGSGGELLSCDKCPNIYLEVCVTCGSGGELLSCDKCPNIYHIECILPPLRRKPRGVWLCANCRERKANKDHDSDDSSEVCPVTRRCRREAEDLPLHNAELQDLLAEIMKHKDAWPFVRPVQKIEVPDYYDVITKPMDFGTIKYKLNMGEYTCDEEFMSDAVLVFENCNTYNDSDADVYRCGVRLLKVFEKKSKELGLKLPEEMQDDDGAETEQPTKRKRTK
ncbi:PHD-finger [Popillia japonica]|uniref:PHD-finger n=1 Tax=Popillia japonica TaxID=7064 RepID=A0AAW1MR18_POPJA